MLKFFKIVGISLICLGAFGTANAAPVGQGGGKTIIVSKLVPNFKIILPSNPTTGYGWRAERYDPQLLTIASHTYYPPNQKLPGASGVEVWVVQVKPAAFNPPRILKINMVYARPSAPQQVGKQVQYTIMMR